VKRRTRISVLAVASACGLAASLFGASAAQADPTGSPAFRTLAGVGSDTTTPLMNALSNTITISGQKVLASYDATGSATIQTQSSAACVMNRPNGSGAGRAALLASLEADNGAGDGCLQYSRSSSVSTAATGGPKLTYVPYAVDAVTYAITANSIVPRSLTLAELQAIYQCNPAYVGTGPNYSIVPLLPQPGSGTRSFWETEMGITDTQVTSGSLPCISDTSGGSLIEEQDGRVLSSNTLIPFSIASYDAEESQTISDVRGNAVLGVINGITSQSIDADFPVTREVYNVIPTAQENTAPYSTVFVGAGSLICSNTATIEQYGFAQDPNCGSTSTTTQ
jgi:ABC-type phosphate transport system substrate-binding protein